VKLRSKKIADEAVVSTSRFLEKPTTKPQRVLKQGGALGNAFEERLTTLKIWADSPNEY
jgi:hypothetical protein